jgi:hypothetical protein
MDRLSNSPGVHRDDDEAFVPGERETEPQAMRSVPGTTLSRLFVPDWLRFRAITVDVSTPRESYPEREAVPFTVTMKNALPIPVEIPTQSPVLWQWHVDGHPEAARVTLRDPPEETRGFRFDRGERKQFRRRWNQLFRVSDSEWTPADTGTHTISAALNVAEPARVGLRGETTVRVEPER